MSKVMRKLVVALAFVLGLAVFSACTPKDDGKTINFWGWGDDAETEVFRQLVEEFNAANPDIKVVYTPKPAGNYVELMERTLGGSRAPDVFYVGDAEAKKWAKLGYLTDLTEYIAKSEVIDTSNIWESGLTRYQFNTTDQTWSEDAPIFGLPKDIGPTVIYYNKDAFKAVGVTVISKPLNDPTITEAEKRGYNPETKVFNNRIAMTSDECDALAALLTKSKNDASPTTYGFYTNWWFSYGWSVDGDCTKFNEQTGKWEFTLGDTASAGVDESGVPYPSMREAFKYFVSLSTEKGISPKPNAMQNTGKSEYFTSQKVAMLVDIRATTVTLRRDAKFDWDVAPLPVYKNGHPAGHSGSMAMGIWSRSKKKDLAFRFVEYISGPVGQARQAATGFNIPNQKDIAKSNVFLQPDKKPANSIIFVEAAEYQRPGDWWYMPDRNWIDVWAPTLNGDVLNGNMSVDAFFDQYTSKANQALAKYS